MENKFITMSSTFLTSLAVAGTLGDKREWRNKGFFCDREKRLY